MILLLLRGMGRRILELLHVVLQDRERMILRGTLTDDGILMLHARRSGEAEWGGGRRRRQLLVMHGGFRNRRRRDEPTELGQLGQLLHQEVWVAP